jgi:hypothetical protein
MIPREYIVSKANTKVVIIPEHAQPLRLHKHIIGSKNYTERGFNSRSINVGCSIISVAEASS